MTPFKPTLYDDSDPLYSPMCSPSKGIVYWRPTPKWRQAGYQGKVQALPGHQGDGRDADRAAEARRLTRAMLATLGIVKAEPVTWGEVIQLYLTDDLSPFQNVRPKTREGYLYLCGKWRGAIGHIRVDATDYRMLKGIERAMQAKGRSVSYIHRLFTMLRGLTSYARMTKVTGAKDVHEVLSQMTFQVPPRKTFAPTRAQVLAVVDEADARGHFAFATGVLMQWVFMLRGIDLFGQWVKANGQGGIVKDGKAWVDGLTWDMVEPDLSGFSKVLSKTRKSLPEPIRFDLSSTPEVRARLRLLGNAGRVGPVLKMESTGLPYTNDFRARTWRRIADRLGLPPEMKMMDSRAGAITDGQQRGVDLMTLRNAAGHMNTTTTEGYTRGRDASVANVIRLRGERGNQS